MPNTHSRLLAALVFAPLFALAQNTDCPASQQVRLTIQNSPFTALPGQLVRYSIFAAPVANTSDPGGDLTFFDNTTNLGTASLARAQTTFSATFYSAGPRFLRIVYTGDATYCAAVYAFTQVVDRLTPTISLAATPIAATAGTLISLTAQISPPAPTGVTAAAGPVQFLDNGTLIGTADLVLGKATFSTGKLAAGTHPLTAVLIGDPNWYSVRTTPLAVTITPAATVTLLSATATATDVTFRVNVTSTGVIPQTGTVQLMDTTNSTSIATIAVPATSVTLPLAKVPAGHPIAAVYTEGVSYSSSTSSTVTLAAFLNAAGGPSPNIAADEIVSLYGGGFAGSTSQSTGTVTTLGGVTVTIADRTGTSRNAALYLVSPTQINLIVPTAVASGPATLTVTGSTAAIIPIQLAVTAVAPGLFNPGPQILRVAPDGTQTLETVTTSPIVIGPDPTYLVLYSTGLRNRSSLNAVIVTVGNLTLPALYAGPQTQFSGLDQVNVLLPDTLRGAGRVNLSLTVDSQPTNTIPLQFQ